MTTHLVPALTLVLAIPPTSKLPEGLPVSTEEVVWYDSERWFQNESAPMGSLWQHPLNTHQHWNSEFPWRTGGLDAAPADTRTRRFYKLTTPPRVWLERGRSFSNAGPKLYYRWQFSPGTLFGEVIEVAGRVVEVGLIEFHEASTPIFRTFRPFATRSDIPEEYIVHESTTIRTVRNTHPGKVINVTGLYHVLDLTPGGVREVLGRPFKDVTDVTFSTHAGHRSTGPTASRLGGIAPAGSLRGLFNTRVCAGCHATAGMEGRLLDPRPTPDKYGTIRGGGHIFSLPHQWVLGPGPTMPVAKAPRIAEVAVADRSASKAAAPAKPTLPRQAVRGVPVLPRSSTPTVDLSAAYLEDRPATALYRRVLAQVCRDLASSDGELTSVDQHLAGKLAHYGLQRRLPATTTVIITALANQRGQSAKQILEASALALELLP